MHNWEDWYGPPNRSESLYPSAGARRAPPRTTRYPGLVPDLYAILGVPRDATTDEVKKAFRRVAKECHPDHAGDDPEASTRFQRARAACDVLTDSLQRRFYDVFGKTMDELGFDERLARDALRTKAQEATTAAPPRVARVNCPHCRGTGWRSGGRACDCDPTLAGNLPPTPDWDPFERTGDATRVRMKPKIRYAEAKPSRSDQGARVSRMMDAIRKAREAKESGSESTAKPEPATKPAAKPTARPTVSSGSWPGSGTSRPGARDTSTRGGRVRLTPGNKKR